MVKTITIATWNVNSVRARASRIDDWLKRSDVDVVAFQETKAKDENFPWELFERLGYEVAHHGVNQWNGVAVASRIGLKDVARGFEGQPGFSKAGDPVLEARAIGATVASDNGSPGIRVWSLYVPNGRALDDPHMPYKLRWLNILRQNATSWLKEAPDAAIALAGDWNVAPFDTDVWDIKEFEGLPHVSAEERKAFFSFLEDGTDGQDRRIPGTAFYDKVREYKNDPSDFTYWDYKQLRFQKKEGMRIDFILTSRTLTDRIIDAAIDYPERKGKGASDHVPVIIEVKR